MCLQYFAVDNANETIIHQIPVQKDNDDIVVLLDVLSKSLKKYFQTASHSLIVLFSKIIINMIYYINSVEVIR